ncbi:MAG: hypothetical protein AAF960_02400 [Bacteroidota bacterium]
MNALAVYALLLATFFNSVEVADPTTPLPLTDETPTGLSLSQCTSSFNGDVTTYTLKDGYYDAGHAIWISRKNQRAKAKYFAHKQDGNYVHTRYAYWRRDGDKSVILKSSGAYATGWNGSDVPVGVTVDNGVIVNRNYTTDMDGLVIVYATGGIAVSNIEDGDLYLESIGRKVDIRKSGDRARFLQWAVSEKATVFQMHLMAYKNQLKVGKYNSSSATARRKLLALARSNRGELFHTIFYFERSQSLYDATDKVLNLLRGNRMDVIAMINLDTGGFDILNTGGDATDCSGSNIWGSSSNYDDMTNLLTYEYN